MKKTKFIVCLMLAAVCLSFAACGAKPDDGKTPGNALAGITFPLQHVEEFGESTAVKTVDGVKFSSKDSSGGYTAMWNKQLSLKDLKLGFKVENEKIVNPRKWMGFAFSSSNELWYDSCYSILVLFRLNYDASGIPTGIATFNIVATLAGFQKIELESTEAKNVPINLSGENTFEMKYLAAPIDDWSITVNNTNIVVKPQGESTADSTADFKTVNKNMTDSKMYLQFASNRLKDDGKTSFTVLKVNGENMLSYFE